MTKTEINELRKKAISVNKKVNSFKVVAEILDITPAQAMFLIYADEKTRYYKLRSKKMKK